MDTHEREKRQDYTAPTLVRQGTVTERTFGHTGWQGYDGGSTTGATYKKVSDD